MKRILVAAAVLALGVSAVVAQQDVAVQQQNQMKDQGKYMYGVVLKMVKGDTPFDQAAAEAALQALGESVAKIPTVFTTNPKEDVVNATFGSSQKIWQSKADFDAKVPPVSKAIADTKGTFKDAASLKVAFDAIQAKSTSCHDDYRVKLK
jgi:cytochrome c556